MEITTRPIRDYPKQETQVRRAAPFHRRVQTTEGWTTKRDISFQDTRELLVREVKFLGAAHMVLELDVKESELRNDGWPRASAIIKPRVVVSFDSRYGPLRYSCDTYKRWQDNVHAIARGLESLRAVDRYGVTTKGEQYSGWKALPPSKDTVVTKEQAARIIIDYTGSWSDQAAEIMTGEFLDNDLDEREALVRMALRRSHPDHGGTNEEFRRVQAAREVLKGTVS